MFRTDLSRQRGTATLTAVMIMGLLALFAAASLSRVTTESLVMGNDHSHTKAFFAAQASLELMSRDFERVFDVQLRPTEADITRIEADKPAIDGFLFDQDITQAGQGQPIPIGGDSPFSGLMSLRTPWRIQAVATYGSGAQVQLTRTFYNHQIPIFQFGIFYEDDMELHPGPQFNFGGRVHSNGHLFLAAGNNLYFRSRVTAAKEIVRDVVRNGASVTTGWNGKVWVANQSGVMKELVIGKASVKLGPDYNGTDADMPDGTQNTAWSTDSAIFGGNLLARQRPLRLPLTIGTNNDPVEIIKRGKSGDDDILRDSRFYNEQGFRVSLSDSQSQLPGGTGGVRLDMMDAGTGDTAPAGTRGYRPPAMGDGYQATRFNGHRVYTGPSYDGNPRQTWIKIEIVTRDPATLAPIETDVTTEMLSLGFTERSGIIGNDARAIFKLQRYEIFGPPVKVAPSQIFNGNTVSAAMTSLNDQRGPAASPPVTLPLPVYSYNDTGTVATSYSYVATSALTLVTIAPGVQEWRWVGRNAANSTAEATAHLASQSTSKTPFEEQLSLGGTTIRAVPFPIKMFDTREGLYNDGLATTGGTSWTSLYTSTGVVAPNTASGSVRVPVSGVMSVINIDMFNLSRFLGGAWNGLMPANPSLPGGSLSSDDIPDNGGAGWIVYVSDRRGDRDDDGEYDMENVFIANSTDTSFQKGEDVNHNGSLQYDYNWESRRFSGQTETYMGTTYDVSSIESDVAAVNGLSGGGDGLQVYADRYFRRASRIINGRTLSGSVTVGGVTANLPGTLNKGFSISSENAVYILGDLNTQGLINPAAPGDPSQPADYTGPEVPFGILSDAIIVLSNNWLDGKSFRSPMRRGDTAGTRQSTQTSVRCAFLMGDTLSTSTIAPNQGGGDPNLSGGVHNFPRFLEQWGDPNRLNYCGSLINLFNSRNNNGSFKCCANVYSPPRRNWVFNTAYLDINRLPPGTPFFQYVQMTGFRQTVRQLQ